MSRHSLQADVIVRRAESEELEKLALGIGKLLGRFSRLGAGAGTATGAAAGAGVGAATGAAADSEDRTRGALLGALGGAALGGGAGFAGTGRGREIAKHFGQRQWHGMTGHLPGKGYGATHTMTGDEREKALKAMEWTIPKKHVADTGQAVENLKKSISEGGSETAFGGLPKWFSESRIGKAWENSKPRELLLKNRIMQDRANTALIDQGLTSIPGAAKGYALGAQKPGDLTRLQQVKANLVAPGLAVGLGLPALSLVGSGVNVAESGDMRQLGKDVVETGGFSAFAGLPLLPAMAVGQGLSTGAGMLLGKKSPEELAPRQHSLLNRNPNANVIPDQIRGSGQ